jgi:hypothetical protein
MLTSGVLICLDNKIDVVVGVIIWYMIKLVCAGKCNKRAILQVSMMSGSKLASTLAVTSPQAHWINS